MVKVEPLIGDPLPGMSAYFAAATGEDMNPPFELDNRGKRSIGVDYGTDAGRAVLADLIAGADVFVTNLRVDALERAGLDHATLTALHPRLVYAQRDRPRPGGRRAGPGGVRRRFVLVALGCGRRPHARRVRAAVPAAAWATT